MNRWRNVETIKSNINIVTADDLAPPGVKPSADTVMNTFV